jgi:IGR protein motif
MQHHSTPLTSLFFRPFIKPITCIQSCRSYNKVLVARPLPPPTPFVPDVEVFLSLIGRQMKQFTSKIPSWEALFKMSSIELQKAGVEPAKKRRYLLWCRERFRQAVWGIGGDFKYVSPDGIAFLRTAEVPSGKDTPATALRGPGMKKIIVNVPPPNVPYEVPVDTRQPKEVYLTALDRIGGLEVKPIKGGHGQWARLIRIEGLWETKQGKKKLGGERRRKETIAKLRKERRKKERAAAGV